MTNKTISNQYKYDINGNITSIKDGNNITLTYKAKDLETYSDSSKQIYERYYYNDKHLRVKKEILDSNGNVTSTITYTYDNNDNLIYQKQGNISLTFLYDNSNMLYGFIYNGYTYYYIRNILNDILGIVDIQGNQIVEYRYLDAWGNHSVFSRKVIHRSSISDSIIDGTIENVPNTDPSFIGNINPFRYKGYYYDKETQLYWVSSRYYSPELCRWISPDSIEYLDPESINGLNLYAYCGNDPINKYYPTGHIAISTLVLIIVGAAVLTTAGAITYGAVTDTPVVLDFSVSAGMGAGVGGKVGISIVLDFKNDSFGFYPHYGYYYGAKYNTFGFSYSVGLISNYENEGDYAGPFVDFGGGFYGGIDHCYDPRYPYDNTVRASSITFGNNIGAYYGYDYYDYWGSISFDKVVEFLKMGVIIL